MGIGGVDMTTLFTIIFLISSIALIISVLLQEDKSNDGLGALRGETDNFFGKTKSRSKEAILNKITTISGIGFMLSALALAAL